MAKIQLGVIFGSRSCEREVAIISAVQLMNHVNTEKYDVIPVYIAPDGRWYTGDALRKVQTFTAWDPAKAQQVHLDLTAGSGALTAINPGKGLFGKQEQVTAPCRACWNWQTCPTRQRASRAAPLAWTRS